MIPDEMSAVEIETPGGPEVLKLTTRPTPKPGAGEALIKIHAAGVNRPEVLQRQGLYPPPPGATDIPGLEAAGEIVAVGDGVDEALIGRRVCALLPGGGYAQYALAPAGSCLTVPAGLSMEEAAGLPETFFTVWANAFDDAELQEGETLLVHGGTSGIGAAAIAMAKARGARVFATAGAAEKVEACRRLGADLAFNYKDDEWEKGVKDAGGADVVLDMAGGDFVARNLDCLTPGGRHVSIAFLRGPEATIPIFPLMQKRLRLSGSTMKARAPAEKARLAAALEREIWPLLESGAVKPVVDRTFPLEAAADAHRRMEAGEHIGKIILKVA